MTEAIDNLAAQLADAEITWRRANTAFLDAADRLSRATKARDILAAQLSAERRAYRRAQGLEEYQLITAGEISREK